MKDENSAFFLYMYHCVIKPSDVLLVCKTARQELNVLMWSMQFCQKRTGFGRILDYTLKAKFSLVFFSLSWIGSLRCQFEAHIFAHSHKHESNHKGGLQCFLVRVRIWTFKLSLLYHFRGDSTLFSWTANVRDWSKQKNSRFRQRLRVSKRWNQNDFHKFSWSPADFLFSTLKSQFYSCQQPENLANIYFH